jgi:hypothetical protein
MDQLQHQLTAALLGLTLVAAACGNDGTADRAQAAVHIDSAVSPETELARFRDGLADPGKLIGGANSRDALVRLFALALEARDTSALARLVITRGEFAYVYYPSHPQARAPYNLSPGLMWFMLEGHSRRGLVRALQQRGGAPLHYVGHRCPQHERLGDNAVWAGCSVVQQPPGGKAVAEVLFGPIIERGGRFKFVSYSNKL